MSDSAIDGAELIAKERRRQIEGEGWTAEHDAEHRNGEMAMAAACYAAPTPIRARVPAIVPCGCRSVGECPHFSRTRMEWADPWPWAPEWDKRGEHDRIRQLVIAGALIAAEIDRLQREARDEALGKPQGGAA